MKEKIYEKLRNKNSTWKYIGPIAILLLAIFSMTMTVEAYEMKTIERNNGLAADAAWYDGSTDTYLSVINSNDGTDLYLSTCTYENDIYKCKSGYKYTTEKIFDANKKLTGATLSPVDIDLYSYHCDDYGCYGDYAETVKLQAKWDGIGDIYKDSYKSMSKSGNYVAKYSSSSSIRNAKATASVINQNLGESTYGTLLAFKSVSMTTIK